MKMIINKILLLLTALSMPGVVFSHPGHGLDQEVHSLLHGEHLLVLGAIVLLIYLVNSIRGD